VQTHTVHLIDECGLFIEKKKRIQKQKNFAGKAPGLFFVFLYFFTCKSSNEFPLIFHITHDHNCENSRRAPILMCGGGESI